MLNFTNDEVQTAEELPWLIFSLNQQSYAVSSTYIISIGVIPNEVTPIPMAPPYVRGIITLRGEIVPLVDLRALFSLPSKKEEMDLFRKELETRKQDHIDWLKELERCVSTGDRFTLTTDPHKCAFGKWYDSFESNNSDIAFALKKIEEPHRLLHESANQIVHLIDSKEPSAKEEMNHIIHTLYSKHLTDVIKYMDQAIESLSQFRIMNIVLNIDGVNVGILVDEVKSVENVIPVCNDEILQSTYHTKYVSSMARTEKDKEMVSVLNTNELTMIAQNLDISTF